MSFFGPENILKITDHPQPRSLSDLFVSCTLLALQGFGGVVVIVHRELVEKKRWLTQEEFIEEWAVAQIMPGPNVVNLCLMLGARYFGLPGAMAAIAGLLTVPLLVVLLAALAYAHYGSDPAVAGALRGMGAVAAGLIIATGIKLSAGLKTNALGIPVCVALALACFAGIALLHWPLAYVLLPLGAIGCPLAYRRLKR